MRGKGLAVWSDSMSKNRGFRMYLAFQRIPCKSIRSWVRCLKERCNEKMQPTLSVQAGENDSPMVLIKIRLMLTFISGGE